MLKATPQTTETVVPDRSRISAGAKKIRDHFSEADRNKIIKAPALTFDVIFDDSNEFERRGPKPSDLRLAILLAGLERAQEGEVKICHALQIFAERLPAVDKRWFKDLRTAVQNILESSEKQAAKGYLNVINEDDFLSICATATKRLEHHNNDGWQKLFRYGSEIVEIEENENGETSIAVLNFQTFKARVNTYIDFKARVGDGNTFRGVSCPDDVANFLFAHPFKGLRHLNGLIRTPTFDASGNLISEPGYHAPSGLYYVPPSNLSIVMPSRVSAADLKEAREALCDLFADFPLDGYTRGQLEASVLRGEGEVPASFLAIVGFLLEQPCRHLIGHNPVMPLLVSKTTPGAGGGLIAKVAQMVIEGRTSSRQLAKTEDERRKAVFTALRGSPATIFWDNLPAGQTVDSPTLASLFTESVWVDRELGRSGERSFPIKSSFILVGNRPLLSDELRRRMSLCEIIPNEANPEHRTGFKYPELMTHVSQNRAKYLGAVLVLVQNWLQAGRPMPAHSRAPGNYEAYHRVVVGTLEAAAPHWTTWGRNRVKLDDIASDDSEEDSMSELLTAWASELGLGGKVYAQDLCQLVMQAKIELPIRKGHQADDYEYNPKALAKYLKSFAGRVFEITYVVGGKRLITQPVTVERAANREGTGYGWHLTRKAVAGPLAAPVAHPDPAAVLLTASAAHLATVPAPTQSSAEVVQLGQRGQRGRRSSSAQSGNTPNALLIAAQAAKAG